MHEEVLTAKQVDSLRAVLEAERERLRRTSQETIDFAREKDGDRYGRDSLDHSTEEAHHSTELRLKGRENVLLGKILSALERLEAGTLDECADCEEPIGFSRLSARPVTDLCIVCKEEREREERRE